MNKTNLRTLYSKTKLGKIYKWSIWTNKGEVHTEYGIIDGEMQRACYLVSPKNIGKSNETNIEEQAQLEADSKYSFKLSRKYALTPENAQQEVVFLPMLASNFEKQKKAIEYPAFIQPKLNGVRCLAFWDQDDDGIRFVRLFSRSGKDYSLPHIQSALKDILPPQFVLDGELYIHDESLQTINSFIKKWREGPNGSIKIRYHVYDGFEDYSEPFHTRWEMITQNVINDLAINSPIQEVFTKTVHSEEEVYQWHHTFVSKNYEGVMVRKADMSYELGHRSRNLLKVKSFQDAEFVVIGHSLGIGKASNSVIWLCEQEEGKTFSVVPKGTLEEREFWAENAKKYYGKKLTVKFFEKTDDNIPQFPVGIGFRLNEDLPLEDKI